MHVISLPEAHAFNEGSSLWIIKNDPSLIWWKKIDLYSKYLLSENVLRDKKLPPPQLEKLVSATGIKLPENKTHLPYILIGTEDHFQNKWVLLWDDLTPTEFAKLLEKTVVDLKINSLRFFSDSKLIDRLKTSHLASSTNITYIENT